MTKAELIAAIHRKKSFLTVGLDPEIEKIPFHLRQKHNNSPSAILVEFCCSIVEATLPYTVSYKLNTAYFEAYGAEGWTAMDKVISYIRQKQEPVLVILDAKRGDIGNTSRRYAEALFGNLQGDAVTLSPYMGKDSVEPFLAFSGKWVVILALTSNSSSSDFQTQVLHKTNEPLYKTVLSKAATWGTAENTMFVVGATHPSELIEVRKIVPYHFLLVPGVGAQGGTVAEVAKSAINSEVGLLINSSRNVLYADGSENYCDAAKVAAKQIQNEMQKWL